MPMWGFEKGRIAVVSRRDFLRVGSLSVVGLSVAEQSAMARARDMAGRRSCIFLMMTGGASQLDTFDPKPDAPAEIRGPLRAISTAIPGVHVSECLPGIAERARKLAIVRSLYHDAAPIHETGFQLLQTGRLSQRGRNYPSFGSVASRVFGPRDDISPYVILPRPIQNTGVNAYRGQAAGFIGDEFDPAIAESDQANPQGRFDHASIQFEQAPQSVRQQYGDSRFGRLCWQAGQLVEQGVRCVTVNLFDSLHGQVTWDSHASKTGAPSTLYDYRDTLCPQFDRAYCALIDDLDRSGLLDHTLVVATGEFGRTPRLNENGGRDHWPGVWSGLFAGGGVQGGQVIGASDQHAAVPTENPIHASEVTASIYRGLGLSLDTMLTTEDGTDLALVDAQPVSELFG